MLKMKRHLYDMQQSSWLPITAEQKFKKNVDGIRQYQYNIMTPGHITSGPKLGIQIYITAQDEQCTTSPMHSLLA